jgi:acetyltransferase-like isoleucine patch superfamily enzyme
VNSYGLSIGKNFAINSNVVIDGLGGVYIGDNTGIGPNTVIISQDHNMLSRFSTVGENSHKNSQRKPIRIGSNVWIGANCFIKAGVELGNNSVVGACSNVLTDLPEDSKVIGSPARPYFQVMREFLKSD